MMMTAVSSMYRSSAEISSRSSTSRKTEMPGTSRHSCRLMAATWSWPVPQM